MGKSIQSLRKQPVHRPRDMKDVDGAGADRGGTRWGRKGHRGEGEALSPRKSWVFL